MIGLQVAPGCWLRPGGARFLAGGRVGDGPAVRLPEPGCAVPARFAAELEGFLARRRAEPRR